MSEVRLVDSISPTVSRRYAGSTIRFGVSVYVDNTLTDTSAITFLWKLGRYGTETTVTPTRSSTGVYYADAEPTEGGDLFFRWDTEGALDVAKEGSLNIAPSQFTL